MNPGPEVSTRWILECGVGKGKLPQDMASFKSGLSGDLRLLTGFPGRVRKRHERLSAFPAP
jgi:hypothetical protein